MQIVTLSTMLNAEWSTEQKRLWYSIVTHPKHLSIYNNAKKSNNQLSTIHIKNSKKYF